MEAEQEEEEQEKESGLTGELQTGVHSNDKDAEVDAECQEEELEEECRGGELGEGTGVLDESLVLPAVHASSDEEESEKDEEIEEEEEEFTRDDARQFVKNGCMPNQASQSR